MRKCDQKVRVPPSWRACRTPRPPRPGRPPPKPTLGVRKRPRSCLACSVFVSLTLTRLTLTLTLTLTFTLTKLDREPNPHPTPDSALAFLRPGRRLLRCLARGNFAVTVLPPVCRQRCFLLLTLHHVRFRVGKARKAKACAFASTFVFCHSVSAPFSSSSFDFLLQKPFYLVFLFATRFERKPVFKFSVLYGALLTLT